MEFIGWLSSLILVVTILTQITKQWRARSGEGVSTWLFVGQIAASAGFTAYSVLQHNWVFIVTNSLMLASAVLGGVITWRFKHQGNEDDTTAAKRSAT
jgi:uncharacterized protein with PQ loop repeat